MNSFGTKVKAVRVGEEKHTDFSVHEDLLKRSAFFQAALATDGLSLTSNVILLPQVQASDFGIYVQWLYSKRLHTRVHKVASSADFAHRREWTKLVRSYLIGEKLGDSKLAYSLFPTTFIWLTTVAEFRDTVMDAILDWCKEASSDDCPVILNGTAEVYEGCPAGSPLRRLFSDIAAWRFTDATIQGLRLDNGWPPREFVLDTLKSLSSRFQPKNAGPFSISKENPINAPMIRGRGTCDYHCHGEKVCYKVEE